MASAEHQSGRAAVVAEADQETPYTEAAAPEGVAAAAFPYVVAVSLARPGNPYTAELTELDQSLSVAERMGLAAVQGRAAVAADLDLDRRHPYRMSRHTAGGRQVAGCCRRGRNWDWNT